jgi:hypothetical protein
VPGYFPPVNYSVHLYSAGSFCGNGHALWFVCKGLEATKFLNFSQRPNSGLDLAGCVRGGSPSHHVAADDPTRAAYGCEGHAHNP